MTSSGETPAPEVTPDEMAAGIDVAKRMRVVIFVVAYNAEAHIPETLRRIPHKHKTKDKLSFVEGMPTVA